MSLKIRVKNWLTCACVAVVAVWAIGCAKEATTPASLPSSSSSPDSKEPLLQESQAGSETKPGAEVPEPAPEKEKESTDKPAETTEKPAEEKPTEAKPNETEEKKE